MARTSLKDGLWAHYILLEFEFENYIELSEKLALLLEVATLTKGNPQFMLIENLQKLKNIVSSDDQEKARMWRES